MPKALKIVLCSLVALPLGLAFWWKYTYPYGHRVCYLPCLWSALRTYAGDNQGWFPKGAENSLEDLRKLSPNYLHFENLAGVSGSRKHFRKRYSSGAKLTENDSSWEYFPGFNETDPPELAIVWEKASGVSGNGHRMPPGGHIVGQIGGMKYVPASEWQTFTNEQARLRAEILSTRGTTEHGTN